MGAYPIRAGLVRVPRGAKAPWSMGRFQGRAARKLPSLGLDEIVSMKWSWGYRGSRNAPLIGDATARRCERVSRGAIAL